MNPFSPESIKAAVDQAVLTNVVPDGRRGVLLVAPTMVNGQLEVKATVATRVGDHWQVGADVLWHHEGDLGAGITVAASW